MRTIKMPEPGFAVYSPALRFGRKRLRQVNRLGAIAKKKATQKVFTLLSINKVIRVC